MTPLRSNFAQDEKNEGKNDEVVFHKNNLRRILWETNEVIRLAKTTTWDKGDFTGAFSINSITIGK